VACAGLSPRISARFPPVRPELRLAVTVTIQARDKAQLDAIYMELTAHEAVLMAL